MSHSENQNEFTMLQQSYQDLQNQHQNALKEIREVKDKFRIEAGKNAKLEKIRDAQQNEIKGVRAELKEAQHADYEIRRQLTLSEGEAADWKRKAEERSQELNSQKMIIKKLETKKDALKVRVDQLQGELKDQRKKTSSTCSEKASTPQETAIKPEKKLFFRRM